MSLGQPQYAVRSAHFHPTDDSRLLVVNDHDELRLCQHEEETLIPGMRLVEGVRMAGFSKKGREVVAHGTDGFIKTWRVDALPLQQERSAGSVTDLKQDKPSCSPTGGETRRARGLLTPRMMVTCVCGMYDQASV